MSTLSREQLALIAAAQAPIEAQKAKQAKQSRSRKAYIKALPMNPLTPKADQSRWALLQKGTESTHTRNVCQIDARPKAQLGDRRLMRECANLSQEDILYKVPANAGLVDIFIEFLRVRKVRADREAALALEGRLNAQEYRLLKRALNRGELTRVSEILERTLNTSAIK